jgi:hypothetical protein
MRSLPFYHLVRACSMSVAETAQRHGKSVRTIRRWCEELPISHRVGGGPHRISVPLADLYAFGRRSELAAFMDGKPPAAIVLEAFELHGALKALVDFQAKRLQAEGRSTFAMISANCVAGRDRGNGLFALAVMLSLAAFAAAFA